MSDPTDETKIACPHCGQHILIESSMLGTELQCPACNQSFTAPEADTDESETSVAEPPVREAGGEEISTRTGIKTSLRAAWIRWMRPAVCFVLASLWFVSRSVVRLVVKAVRFPVRVIFTPAKNLFSRLAGSGFLQRHAKLRRVGIVVRDAIRSFGSRFVVRPGRWIGLHVFRPVDECWCRYEAARASAGDDGGIGACGNPNPSLKRRIAYVATALVAVAVVFCTSRVKPDSGSGSYGIAGSQVSNAGSFSRLDSDFVLQRRAGSKTSKTDSGDPLFQEAMCYYEGNGVLQNYNKAVELLFQASGKGSREADAKLASIYWNGEAGRDKDEELAVKYALKHGNDRTTEASMILGLASLFGYKTRNGEVASDFRKAYGCFCAASERKQAQFFKGLMEYHGVGTRRSAEKAAETFYDCCREKDDVLSAGDAAVCLGYLYYKGEGVSQNLDQAKDWLLWGWQHGHAPKVAVFNELGQYPGGMDLLLTASKEYYRPLGGFVFQW